MNDECKTGVGLCISTHPVGFSNPFLKYVCIYKRPLNLNLKYKWKKDKITETPKFLELAVHADIC